MLTIAAIGAIAAAAAGMLGAIATVTQRNAEAAAASAEAGAESLELRRQIIESTEIFDAQQEEAQAAIDAANQAAQFNIGETTIAGERAVGAREATVGASGLGGVSKVGVVEQLQGDITRQIGQLETERQEMLRAGAAEIEIAQLEFTEDVRQSQREVDLLSAEALSLEQESLFGLDDLSTIGIGALGGLASGASILSARRE